MKWSAERLGTALLLAGCATPPIVPTKAMASPSPFALVAAAPKAAVVAPVAAPAAPALPTDDRLIDDALATGGAALKSVLASPEKYRFQVIYGVIANGALERHGYRADAEYYFPASSMKVPIALASYDRLAILRGEGKTSLTRDAAMRIYPSTGGGAPFATTLARETLRALVVSDNTSANRLLGFVGHREAHETLWGLGLASARIHTGFATGGDIDPAEVSPRIDMGTETLAARRSDLALPATDAKGLDVGTSNIVDGKVVQGPLSFADKNAIRLRDLQDALVRIMRPELVTGGKKDTASEDDLAYLRQTLGTLPSESGLAGYDRNVVADYQLSPFLRGVERVRTRGKFQIFSKIGQAYGFVIGNAYVLDKESGKAFFLAAAIYANPTEVLNGDSYAYDSIAFPAMADVGEVFCRHAFGAK